MSVVTAIEAKLARVEQSLAQLEREIREFMKEAPSPYRSSTVHKEAKLLVLAYGDPFVPTRFAVLAGEIVHHLRSTLDYLVCAMVQASGHQVTSAHMFPICETETALNRKTPKALEHVPLEAKKIIKSLQPCTSTAPQDTIFYVLNSYDIFDKHRLLNLAVSAAQIGKHLTIGDDGTNPGAVPAIIRMGDPSPVKISPEGTEIFWIEFAVPSPQVTLQCEIEWSIVSEKRGTGGYQPIGRLLHMFKDATENAIAQLRPFLED